MAACSQAASGADEPSDVVTELVAEVRENISTTPGREVYRFVPARLLEQGQVVYYTVRITNPTPVGSRIMWWSVQWSRPTPIYMEDSAVGPGAAESSSLDRRAQLRLRVPRGDLNELEYATVLARRRSATHTFAGACRIRSRPARLLWRAFSCRIQVTRFRAIFR